MAQATLFDPSVHGGMIAQFADIQIACIEVDKMVADYLPPLNHDKMKHWWAEKASQVATEPEDRHIIFMEDSGQATGVVMLQVNTTETGGYRGEVQKLIVSPRHRQKGIARRMMGKLEEVAKEHGKSLLVCYPALLRVKFQRALMADRAKLLDTEKDSPADRVYPKWGYRRVSTYEYRSEIDGADRASLER